MGYQVRPGKTLSLSFISILILFSILQVCFEFKLIQTMPKTPLNISILLDGLFQKLINISGVFEIIF